MISGGFMEQERVDVVIVGAGFGGLQVARTLRHSGLQVLLIDRNNYHTFQPLLYQVATAGLSPENVACSVRAIFSSRDNFRFRMGTVRDVDFSNRTIQMEEDSNITYRHLVLAAGTSVQYFGIDGAREHAVPMKSLTSAMQMRDHILQQFERAENNPELIDDGILNFVLIGGGPTGVETAGALVELFRFVLSDDYSDHLVENSRVVLVEMLPHLLDPYQESLRSYTKQQLEERGVEVMTNTTVNRITEDTVYFEDSSSIPTNTVIWAAGVRANVLADRLDVEQVGGGRLQVESDLTIPGSEQAFAIGDMAGATDGDGNLLPQLAPVAVQQGEHVADQIMKCEEGKNSDKFVYDDPGMMATIGRHDAVIERPDGFTMSGFLAWILWVFLHIAKLIDFRNRVMVFISWVYNYFTYDSSSRLILGLREQKLFGDEDHEEH